MSIDDALSGKPVASARLTLAGKLYLQYRMTRTLPNMFDLPYPVAEELTHLLNNF